MGYAENFVYARPCEAAAAHGRQRRDAARPAAEESHSGSHASYSRRWRTAGGGSMLRMGSHPIGAVIHLKHYEGMKKTGKPIRVKSVLADVAQLTKHPAVQAAPTKYCDLLGGRGGLVGRHPHLRGWHEGDVSRPT